VKIAIASTELIIFVLKGLGKMGISKVLALFYEMKLLKMFKF